MKVVTALKILSLTFTLLLIIVVAPVGFVLLTDANDFKPELEQWALNQGIELDISGDLIWRIYPDIELELNGASLVTEQGTLGLEAALGAVRLQVGLRPLLSGELKILGIEVSDSEVNLTELAEDVMGEIEDAEAGASGNGDKVSMDVNAQLVSVQRLKLEYRSADGGHVRLTIDELIFEQFNLAGEPFPARLGFVYRGSTQPEARVSARALLSIDLEERKYRLDAKRLMFELGGESPIAITAELSAAANLADNQWNLLLTGASLDDLRAKVNASGRIDPLSALGQLELHGGSRFINDRVGRDILDTLSLGAGFDYSPERLLLGDVVAKFNRSQLAASLRYYPAAERANELRLNLNQINLDDLITAVPLRLE